LIPSPASQEGRGDDPRGTWREELLVRLGWILFLGTTPLVFYLSLVEAWGPRSLSAIALMSISGAVSASFALRLTLPWRAFLLVAGLLAAGGLTASLGGPAPGAVLGLLLAVVVAALAFGERGALLALAAAAGLLVQGWPARVEIASYWAEDLPLLSSWVRFAIVFLLLAGLVALLVAGAVRRAEADAAELRRAEAKARASEELFRAIVGDQTEMIVRWKPDGTRTFVNQAYCRVFGTSYEEVVGTSLLPNVAEPDREAVLRKIRSLTPEHPVATDTHESVTASGEQRFQEWTDRGIFDAQGRLVELQSTGRDVTERRAAELALQDSEQRYRLLFDGNPLPMMVYDLDSTRLVAVNEAAVAQYGYSREELLRMTVAELAVPGDPHYAEFLAGLGQPRPPVVHVGLRQQRRRDGSRIDVDMTSLEVPFAGRAARLTLARDVTAEREAMAERARLQAAVERAALEWQRTFDAVEQALLVFDTAQRVVRLNRPAVAMIGTRGPDEVLGRLASELGAREPWPSAARLLEAAATSRAAESLEAREASTGRAWTLSARQSAVGAEGEQRLILVIAEITRLVELQESLRRSETMAAMGSLVAGVAHEVRNPLFGMSATLDTLERQQGSEQRYAKVGAVLRSQLARLQQLTQDLLDYGKPPALRVADASAERLVRVACRSCERLALERGVEVVERVSRELPALRVDAGRMQQVIENLVANAIQHSPRGSVVRVTAEPGVAGGNTVAVIVEDQGPGVRPEDVRHLFEPFFSRRKGGTGLGLSIVRRIVEAHGGRVAVESLERGARFRVTLPLGDRDASRSA